MAETHSGPAHLHESGAATSEELAGFQCIGTGAESSDDQRIARITWAADIEPEPGRWPTFPHCPAPRCGRRLHTASPRRHPDDPRGPVIGPTTDGRCPHCGTDLRAVAS